MQFIAKYSSGKGVIYNHNRLKVKSFFDCFVIAFLFEMDVLEPNSLEVRDHRVFNLNGLAGFIRRRLWALGEGG